MAILPNQFNEPQAPKSEPSLLDALVKARQAVDGDQGSAEAWTHLGSLLMAQNSIQEAKNCFAHAVQCAPDSAAAHNNFGTVLQRLSQLEDARRHYRRALQLAPGSRDIEINLSACLGALGRFAEAQKVLRRILRKAPTMAKAHIVASAIASNLGQYDGALKSIEQAIALAPENTMLLTRRADLLHELGRYEEALADCEHVLRKLPSDAQAWHMKAIILRSLRQIDGALMSFNRAKAMSPAPARIMADQARLFAELGRKKEAFAGLEAALAQQPDLVAAWYGKSYLKRYTKIDADILAMEQIANRPALPFQDRLRLHFALGKAYLDIGEGKQAFDHLNQANALKRSLIDYDPIAQTRIADQLIAASDANTPARGSIAPAGKRPIFVFGMPRSGTTLVEQILASHNLVDSIGESSEVERAAIQTVPALGPRAGALQYLNATGASQFEKLYFVDKTPENFRYINFIATMFPGARMIHCRRDALDTCLSCYSLLFVKGHPYSYDMRELGHYYEVYRRMMAHWQSVMPVNTFLNIDYEVLVSDTRRQVQRMLDYCGLPWDDNCLRFYETKRLVMTSSFDQVRSPIYQSSIKRAEKFRPWLEPLEMALAKGENV